MGEDGGFGVGQQGAGLSDADIDRWAKSARAGSVFSTPMVADPGVRFEYGINTDWLGKVIEAASGSKLDEYVLANITGPLGMDQTAFLMSEDQRADFERVMELDFAIAFGEKARFRVND